MYSHQFKQQVLFQFQEYQNNEEEMEADPVYMHKLETLENNDNAKHVLSMEDLK